MGSGRLPVVGALAALVVAVVASFTFASTPPPSLRGAAAAARFVQAWDRKLHGTYVVDSTLTRRPASGGELRVGTRLVQRPPDRLVIGLGSVDGRVGGRLLRCGPVVAQPCTPSAEAPDYEQDVAAELATMHSYVDGAAPLYSVLDFDDRGCFRLVLERQLPAPPYGDEALFCFDAATGAPTTTVVRRGQQSERTDPASVRATVTDDDLRVPEDKGDAVVVDPPPTTRPLTTTTTAPPPTSS